MPCSEGTTWGEAGPVLPNRGPCLVQASWSHEQSPDTSTVCQSPGALAPGNQPLSLCPQTDTSDPEKVVSAFLKVSSVFKDEATVRTAVQDAVGNVRLGWLLPLRCSGAP